MTKKRPEPNPIEEAIGERATPKLSQENLQKIASDVKKEAIRMGASEKVDHSLPPSKIPDEPSPSEMRNLEELNRSTVERLQETWPEEKLTQEEKRLRIPQIPVSKPDPQPVTKTSSQESPPQKIDEWECPDCGRIETDPSRQIRCGSDDHILPTDIEFMQKEIDKIDEYEDAEKHEAPTVAAVQEAAKKTKYEFNVMAFPAPAEDIELTGLKKYIQDGGFVLSTVAYHIVSLCAQPMTTPSTTTWAFKERAEIPAMVLALLNQPGYIEGIWPSLKIVMGGNKGNATWTAGIATTLAFFDVIRTLPAIEELKNEKR